MISYSKNDFQHDRRKQLKALQSDITPFINVEQFILKNPDLLKDYQYNNERLTLEIIKKHPELLVYINNKKASEIIEADPSMLKYASSELACTLVTNTSLKYASEKVAYIELESRQKYSANPREGFDEVFLNRYDAAKKIKTQDAALRFVKSEGPFALYYLDEKWKSDLTFVEKLINTKSISAETIEFISPTIIDHLLSNQPQQIASLFKLTVPSEYHFNLLLRTLIYEEKSHIYSIIEKNPALLRYVDDELVDTIIASYPKLLQYANDNYARRAIEKEASMLRYTSDKIAREIINNKPEMLSYAEKTLLKKIKTETNSNDLNQIIQSLQKKKVTLLSEKEIIQKEIKTGYYEPLRLTSIDVAYEFFDKDPNLIKKIDMDQDIVRNVLSIHRKLLYKLEYKYAADFIRKNPKSCINDPNIDYEIILKTIQSGGELLMSANDKLVAKILKTDPKLLKYDANFERAQAFIKKEPRALKYANSELIKKLLDTGPQKFLGSIDSDLAQDILSPSKHYKYIKYAPTSLADQLIAQSPQIYLAHASKAQVSRYFQNHPKESPLQIYIDYAKNDDSTDELNNYIQQYPERFVAEIELDSIQDVLKTASGLNQDIINKLLEKNIKEAQVNGLLLLGNFQTLFSYSNNDAALAFMNNHFKFIEDNPEIIKYVSEPIVKPFLKIAKTKNNASYIKFLNNTHENVLKNLSIEIDDAMQLDSNLLKYVNDKVMIAVLERNPNKLIYASDLVKNNVNIVGAVIEKTQEPSRIYGASAEIKTDVKKLMTCFRGYRGEENLDRYILDALKARPKQSANFTEHEKKDRAFIVRYAPYLILEEYNLIDDQLKKDPAIIEAIKKNVKLTTALEEQALKPKPPVQNPILNDNKNKPLDKHPIPNQNSLIKPALISSGNDPILKPTQPVNSDTNSNLHDRNKVVDKPFISPTLNQDNLTQAPLISTNNNQALKPIQPEIRIDSSKTSNDKPKKINVIFMYLMALILKIIRIFTTEKQFNKIEARFFKTVNNNKQKKLEESAPTKHIRKQ